MYMYEYPSLNFSNVIFIIEEIPRVVSKLLIKKEEDISDQVISGSRIIKTHETGFTTTEQVLISEQKKDLRILVIM